jgi:tRNA C32,U32 (ribose-2'-O)-methylase TrmJ
MGSLAQPWTRVGGGGGGGCSACARSPAAGRPRRASARAPLPPPPPPLHAGAWPAAAPALCGSSSGAAAGGRRTRCAPARSTGGGAGAAAPAQADGAPPALAPGARPLLSDVRVVLVAPKTPSNIGAVARAAANFEALSLVIVAPRCELVPDGEAYKVACGSSVLDAARVVGTLAEALADTTSSIGFTRRAGCTRMTHASIAAMLRDFPDAVPGMQRRGEASSSREASSSSAGQQQAELQRLEDAVWQEVDSQGEGGPGGARGGGGGARRGAPPPASRRCATANVTHTPPPRPLGPPAGSTALVFGREESGLTEDELRLCAHACAIPTGRVQPSMNLSHAVAVALAALFERRLAALGLEELPVGLEVQGERPRRSLLPSGLPLGAWARGGRLRVGLSIPVGPLALPSPGCRRHVRRCITSPAPGNPRVQAGLQPAAASELEALLAKVAAVARAVGVRCARRTAVFWGPGGLLAARRARARLCAWQRPSRPPAPRCPPPPQPRGEPRRRQPGQPRAAAPPAGPRARAAVARKGEHLGGRPAARAREDGQGRSAGGGCALHRRPSLIDPPAARARAGGAVAAWAGDGDAQGARR